MTETPQMLGEAQASDGEVFFKDESVDTSQVVTPQSFDSSAFLAGVRPTRRSVQIVERADLVGDMERLAQMYAAADADGDDEACDRIAAEFEQVAEAFHASKRWYTLEKRSSEWVDAFKERTAKELGLDLGDEDSGKKPSPAERRARVTVLLHQVAAQIVSPEGTTAADMRVLLDRNEGELNKLIVAMTYANTQQATVAEVATPGFSLKRSKK